MLHRQASLHPNPQISRLINPLISPRISRPINLRISRPINPRINPLINLQTSPRISPRRLISRSISLQTHLGISRPISLQTQGLPQPRHREHPLLLRLPRKRLPQILPRSIPLQLRQDKGVKGFGYPNSGIGRTGANQATQKKQRAYLLSWDSLSSVDSLIEQSIAYSSNCFDRIMS